MLAFFNTQTLALLAVAVGFVVLCLGLWYLWTNHTQLRTEVQLLRSQQQSGSGSGYQALAAPTASPSSPVPDAGAADITALMRGEAAGACAAATPEVRVCRMPEASMATVVHRTEADGDDSSDGSETSGSEYDDDDEDITDDDEEEEGTQTVAHADAAYEVVTTDEASNALTEMNANATVPDDGQPPVDLVESLLSSIVTNAIDGAVELQGGATVIMSCVDVGDGDDGGADAGAEAAVTVEDVTVEDEAAATAAVEATAEAAVTDDDDDAASALDAGAAAFADELRSHTVAQLKVICQEHQLGVRRANGSSKRKDELVADLVAALYEGGGEEDDAQETASNESTNAAGA
jgi:hypothetical protein